MVGKFYQIPTFFVNDFSKREFCLKKVSFSTRLYKRGAFSHFLIRDWEASQSKNHFRGKMELFVYLFIGLQGLAIHSIGMCKRTRFTNMWLLFSAAINVNRCISKYAF